MICYVMLIFLTHQAFSGDVRSWNVTSSPCDFIFQTTASFDIYFSACDAYTIYVTFVFELLHLFHMTLFFGMFGYAI